MSQSTSPTSPKSPAIPGGFTMETIPQYQRGATDEAGPSRASIEAPSQSDRQGSDRNQGDYTQRPFRGGIPRRGSEDTRDDRIKSRVVNDLGWNWEVERAKIEAMSGSSSSMQRAASEGGASSIVATGLPSTSTMGSRSNLSQQSPYLESPTKDSIAMPAISPRASSKATFPPRIDTSGNCGSASPIPKISQRQTTSQEPAAPLSSQATTFSSDIPTKAPQEAASSTQQSQMRASQQQQASTSSSREKSGRRDQSCDACGKPMTGQFVRALGVVFHLDCFRCRVSTLKVMIQDKKPTKTD